MAIFDSEPEVLEAQDPRQSSNVYQHRYPRLGSDPLDGPGMTETSAPVFNPYYTGHHQSPTTRKSNSPSLDRHSIIRRLKRGVSRPSTPEAERASGISENEEFVEDTGSPHGTSFQSTARALEDQIMLGTQIERPRSALHSGDFRQESAVDSTFADGDQHRHEDTRHLLSTSPVAPWHPDFVAPLPRSPHPVWPERQPLSRRLQFQPSVLQRQRASSHALSTPSFTYKPPTSPLVQSSRPDTPEFGARRHAESPDRSRRHTFSPPSLQHMHTEPAFGSSHAFADSTQMSDRRAGRWFPYQAHQPRRSLNNFTSFPQTPPSGRRPSLSESPLQHAPMVGSYEESILRGRMSTTPSRPLDFVAQIGVLGRGKCKANLRCPPHASVPFPAVFYSYDSGTKSALINDQPSPYVGLIDLENGLPAAEPSTSRRRPRNQAAILEDNDRITSQVCNRDSSPEGHLRRRRTQKAKRRERSPKAPPGGSYRIPEQGQLQIVIKNPNKTAVKLFLVPYDLSDMEPGQKTFIRQRSYSAGPIIDIPLSARKNLGTDRPEASLNASDDPNERPMLRYLVHLHICCTSRGRYYLYKSIRVVFANRVLDGKEKLRNEIQFPEPRFSAYKSGKDKDAHIPGPNTTRPALRSSAIPRPITPPNPQYSDQRPLAHSMPLTEFRVRQGLRTEDMQHTQEELPISVIDPTSHHADCSTAAKTRHDLVSQVAMESPAHTGRGSISPLFSVSGDSTSPFLTSLGTKERQPSVKSESLLAKRLKDLAFNANASRDTRTP